MANVVATLIIALWVAITVFVMVRDWRTSKREGTPMACFSCAALKSGTCGHHCHSTADVDRMIRAAQETLAARTPAATGGAGGKRRDSCPVPADGAR